METLAYIPGRLHFYAVWNDLDGYDSKLVTIGMFDAQTASSEVDTGFGNVEGLVAAWGAFGDFEDPGSDTHAVGGEININPNNSPHSQFELTLPDGSMITRDDLHQNYGGYDGPAVLVHVKPKGNGNQNSLIVDGQPYDLHNGTTYDIASESMTVSLYNDHIHKNGKAMGKWWIQITADDATISSDDDDGSGGSGGGGGGNDGENQWALFGVATSNDGESALVRIDPDTGAGALVMSLSRQYEGLAYPNSDDGGLDAFYGVSDNALWRIDTVAGTETMVGEDSFAGIQALEFSLSQHDGSAQMLYGFTDQEDALLLIDQVSGATSPFSSPVNGLGLQGIVLLHQCVDVKCSFEAIGFD